MRVARAPGDLEARPRAVALGTFDGVHLGHRRVLDAALSTGPALTPTVVTFWPHPRTVLGNEVRLLTTLERRLELLGDAGVGETLVVEFTAELAGVEPDAFVDELLRPLGTELVVAGADFRFGRGRRGDLATFEELGLAVERVELVPGISSTAIRELLAAGDVQAASRLLGRPPEVDRHIQRIGQIAEERRGLLGQALGTLIVGLVFGQFEELVAPLLPCLAHKMEKI